MRRIPSTMAVVALLSPVAASVPVSVPPVARPTAVSPATGVEVRPPAALPGAVGSRALKQAASPSQEAVRPSPEVPDRVRSGGSHSFYFTRAAYQGGQRGWWGGRRSWRTDYPKADRQFLVVLRRVTNLDAYAFENTVRLDDPALRRFPFLYAVEVGYMELSDAEVEGLRSYLLAGGFLVVDDFWGSREWRAFERNIRRVFPDRPIVEVPPDHPVFRTYYQIDELVQVPAVNNIARGRTWEQDGRVPHVRGIFAEDGRLMVAINWNTDLGDAWEWADVPQYPLEYSTFAYEMGVNYIVYALSH